MYSAMTHNTTEEILYNQTTCGRDAFNRGPGQKVAGKWWSGGGKHEKAYLLQDSPSMVTLSQKCTRPSSISRCFEKIIMTVMMMMT